MAKVGVLALQGAFREHREVFDALGVECVDVRTPEHLAGVDALVLPGGESTTMSRLLVTSELDGPLRDRVHEGVPTLGTCAGLILLAREVLDGRPDQVSLDGIDATVRRNAYGTQLASFEAPLQIAGLGNGAFPGVFIRAPVVEAVAEDVTVLAVHDDHPVLCRQGSISVSTFHPELSGDLRIHQWFLESEVRP